MNLKTEPVHYLRKHSTVPFKVARAHSRGSDIMHISMQIVLRLSAANMPAAEPKRGMKTNSW